MIAISPQWYGVLSQFWPLQSQTETKLWGHVMSRLARPHFRVRRDIVQWAVTKPHAVSTHGFGKWIIIPSMDMMYLALIYLEHVRLAQNFQLVCQLLTASIDRLPTVQASQALNELQDDSSHCLSTGLGELDRALLPSSLSESHSSSTTDGGVKRGQVTEIWGPPGTGKTALS